MDHSAGLDVSVKETSVCIVDDTGRIVREVKVASEPEALLSVLTNPGYHFKWIGLEAGPLSQWLYSALAEAGLPVICVETRDMRAVLKAQINKTDRNDARGMAQMMRVGLYRPVHVKTLRSQKLRMLLTHRKLLQSKAIAIDNDLRGTLRNFGLKVGMVGTVKFEARIKELVENLPDLAELVEPLLVVRRVLREQFCIQHRRLLAIVRDDEVCRRLMTTPGVGPVVALTYRATVDVPAHLHAACAGHRARLRRGRRHHRIRPPQLHFNLQIHFFHGRRRRIVAAIQPRQQAGMASQSVDLVAQRGLRDVVVLIFPAPPALPEIAAAPSGHHQDALLVGHFKKFLGLEFALQPDLIQSQVEHVAELVGKPLRGLAKQHVGRPAAAANQDVLAINLEQAFEAIRRLLGNFGCDLVNAELRMGYVRNLAVGPAARLAIYHAIYHKRQIQFVQVGRPHLRRPP